MTTASHRLHDLHNLTWKDLHKSTFSVSTPFQLVLSDGQVFLGEQVVRVIPRRRLVVFGMWQDKPVVAKLFFDRHAKRHMKKDAAGIRILKENRVPTPALYYQGISKDKRVRVLIFQRIFKAKSLEEIWRERESTESLLPLLKAVMVEFATQHVYGVLQNDLHLKNFLITKKTMYSLDGAQVEPFPYLLPKKPSLNNLALFLAQLGVGIEKYQELLFRHYAKSRGWLLKKEDIAELHSSIEKWNVERWQKFEKKIFRSCTDFACFQEARSVGMFDKNYATPELMAFLKNPEAAFNHTTAQFLKIGGSSTVVKVVLDNRELVIKRYNIKTVWHFLRRCLRPTRASQSWRLAQKLHLFGVTTAKPIAFLEKRYLGFRGKSYYVTEYVSGEHAGEYFDRNYKDDSKVNEMVKRITTLLKNIAKLEISHGDLKISNILINQQEQPVLIDLDGTAEHISLSSLQKAWRKEIKRFLKNFQNQPVIGERFEIMLGMRDHR